MSSDELRGGEERLQELIAQFLEAEARGEPIERADLLGSHPECEESLNQFFEQHDRMVSIAGDDSATLPPSPSSTNPSVSSVDDPTLPPHSSTLDDRMEATIAPSSGVVSPTIDGPKVGDSVRYFGDYELLEEIARGGMGVVFKARQTNLNRIVALKMILSGQFAGEDDVQRFHTEAEAAAQLDHPGIVPIFEIGEHAGQHYFSMGYIAGESLAPRVAGGPLQAREAAELVGKICEAMAYAHDRGVIHRDLKPANILIDSTGQPKVTDFGLAKRTEADSGLTGTGQILGTPSYMPPEQASGKIEEVGPLADVYSLGAILYSTLTGRPPFQSASPMDTLLQVLEKDPVPPKQLNPAIDEDLQTICLKCLEKQPERRYGSAQDLLDELNRYLAGEPIVARPIGRSERAWRWCKRKPALAGLFAVAASLLLVLSIGGPTIAFQQAEFAKQQVDLKSAAESARDQAENRRQEAEAARTDAEQAKLEVEREQERVASLLYATRISLAHRELLDSNANRAQQLLNECPPESRNWEWRYLDELTRPEDMSIFAHGIPASVEFMPSGTQLLTRGLSDSKVNFWDVESGLEVNSQVVPGMKSATAPLDDEHLLVVQGPVVAYAGVDRKVEFYGDFGVAATAGSMFAEGKRVAAAFADGTVVLYKRPESVESQAKGEEIFRTPKKVPSDRPHVFSPSARLVVGTDGLLVQVWDVKTGELRFDVKGHGMVIEAVAFDPGGKLLVTVDRAGRIILTDVATGRRLQLLHAHQGGVKCVAFDAEGQRIATGSMDRTCKIFDVKTGSELLTVRGHTATVLDVAFDPSGEKLATAAMDGTVRIWSIANRLNPAPEVASLMKDQAISHMGHAPGLESRIYYSNPTPLYDVLFSPDGRFVASSSFRLGNSAGKPFIKVWSLVDSSLHASFPVPGGFLHTLAYSADSKYLIVASGGAGDAVAPGSVAIWDLETKEEYKTIDGIACMLTRPALNKANDILAVAYGNSNYGKIRSYSFPELELLQEKDVTNERLSAISFSASGDELLSSSTPGGRVSIWNARTGEDLGGFTAHGSGVFQIAISSKDHLATANTDSTIGIWDWRQKKQLAELKGHAVYAVDVDFNPDGTRLVSSSEDETVKVWDLENYVELMSFRDHLAPALGADWSDDGRSIASTARDGAMIIRRIENSDDLEPVDQWVTVFEDDFDRDEPGPNWLGKMMTIEDGKLVGTLAQVPAGGGSFAGSFLVLTGADMPRTVEVSADVSIQQPMLAQIVLTNSRTLQYVAPFIASSTNPYGFIGSQVQHARGEGQQNKMLGGRADVKLESGENYRMRVVRDVDQLKFFLDDRMLAHVRVPTMEADMLQLSGCFGSLNDRITFDNLVVRIPPSAVKKQDIRKQVKKWLAKMLVPEIVSDKIDEHYEDDSDRQLASQTLESLNAGKEGLRGDLLKAFTAVAIRPDASEEDYDIAKRQARYYARQTTDPSERGKIALALVRSGDVTEGLEIVNKAIEEGAERVGYPDALMMATRALAHLSLGDESQAKADHQRAGDLSNTWWPETDGIPGLLAELNEKAPLNADPDRETLVNMILERDRAFWHNGDMKKAYKDVSPDYVLTFGRGETADPYDRVFPRTDAIKLEAIFSSSNPPPFLRLVWDEIALERDGDKVTVKILGVSKLQDNVFRFAHRYEFAKTDRWRIIRQRTWQIDQKIGDWTRHDEDHFAELDRKVEASENSDLAQTLFSAGRFEEALQAIEKVDPPETSKARHFALWGEIAVSCGHFAEGIERLERARVEDPAVRMPWFFLRRNRTLTHHQGNPFGFDFHPSKNLIAATYKDQKVILWNDKTKRKVRTINRAHGSYATDVVFSMDGSKMFTVGFDAVLNVFETETGKRISQHGGHLQRIYRIERHPEKDIVVTASADGTARVWDMNEGKELVSLAGHGGGVMGATFSPDGNQIATACSDGTVRLWDASTGKELAKIDAHKKGAWRVDFTPDGSRLVSCGMDHLVRVWDANDHSELATLKGHAAGIEVVRVSPDGKLAVSADNEGGIWVWDLVELKPIVLLHDSHVNYAARFRGKSIFTAGDDINEWDVDFSRSPLTEAIERATQP